jgi:hypothetical protein
MAHAPKLIARLRVGSVDSGVCSECQEVIIVKDVYDEGKDRVGEKLEQGDRLHQAFEEHMRKKHS